ncbi:hypothetical protein K456DRAFT_1179577 [Colletotrichum gloeosporioides 23]|nr:hypothetical protein K456DRAFT_1179577 [Colletotrichum gloeosporioides 23]
MNNFGAPGRQEAGDTNPVLGLSVQGSTFGDYARVSQQNFQLQNGTFLLQPSEHFLKHLSNIDPRVEKKKIDAAVKIKSINLNALQKLLDQGSEVDRWIRGDSGQFLFVNDSMGRAHTILASKIIDKVETLHAKQYLATSYFFRRSESSKGLSFTASDIVAGLARVCLTDRRLGPQLVSEIQGTYGSSIVGSDLEVTAGILMDILKLLHEQSSEQGILFVVDGIQNCTTDVGRNGLDELATFLKDLAKSYPKSKWLISGRLLDPVEKDLRRLCDSPASICLTSAQVDATFDLDVVVETMTALAQNINATPTHQRLKTLQNLQEDLSWVQYCHAGRTWLSQSLNEPGILGYHRSSQEPFQPSSLGWHFAMRGFEDTISSQVLRVYFSFSDAFPVDVEKASVVHSNILHPAQAVWCLFAQLATLHCEGYADLASLILSFPGEAQQDLKFVHSLVDHHKSTTNRDRPPNVSPVVSWYQGLLSLEMKRMATFTKALIEYLKANGAEVLLIVDCLELVNPGHATEFLTFLSSLECSFRVLLCFNDKDERECASWNGWGGYLSDETVIHEKTEYEECKSSLHFENMHQRREQISNPMHETNQWLWSNTTF